MTCVISGSPIKSVKWFKDGGLVQTDENVNPITSSILTIGKVNSTTQGMYQCFVENEMEVKQAIGQLILSGMTRVDGPWFFAPIQFYYYLHLIIKCNLAIPAFPPKLLDTFQHKIIHPGSVINVECSALGDPLPTMTWQFNGSPLKENSRINIITNSEEDVIRSQLSISNVRTSDGGVYSCMAKNKVSSVFYKGRIDVYGLPFVWPITNRTIIAGEQVILDCYVSGYPIKAVRWLRGNLKIGPSICMPNIKYLK